MQDLQALLFHEQLDKRRRWFSLFEDQIWTPRFNITLPQQRELAYQQLALVAKSGIVSVRDFITDPTNIFTAHEMLGTVSGAAATKFTVHYNLFGGSIVALHTERHKDIFDKIDRLEVTGCFCLTELGFGNNAVQMETTAVYDAKTASFIINSPSVLSQKYWITNGAVHANYALVFAQTHVSSKNEGINAFLVPIRDSALKPYPGVEINDMGYKIGLNGIDNAALKFHKVVIPRVNMLNRYADVNEKGVFSSEVKGIQQRFFKVTQRLLSGRLCIASMTLGGLKTVIYNTVKYSQQRKGVSPNGKSQTPIFEYQLQKNALIPIIARCLGLNMLHNFAKATFAKPQGHSHDLLMICCVDKTLIGWHSERSITTMRERSGGQGFLAANMYGEALASTHAAMTAEGDNRVLMVKVVKDYLSNQLKSPSSPQTPPRVSNIADLQDLGLLLSLFQTFEQHKLSTLLSRMTQLKGQGRSNYEILMYDVSDETQELAMAYGERLALASAIERLELLKESKKIVKNYFVLFAWEVLMREMATIVLEGWIIPDVAKGFKIAYNALIWEAAKDVDAIVSSLNTPVHAIKAPIANDYVRYNSYANFGEVVGAKL